MVGTIDFRLQLGKDAVIMCSKPDHPSNNYGLFFGFYAGDSAVESPKFNLNTQSYEGVNPGFNTLVARYSFDPSKKQLIRS